VDALFAQGSVQVGIDLGRVIHGDQILAGPAGPGQVLEEVIIRVIQHEDQAEAFHLVAAPIRLTALLAEA
jgi:hypothetical protein